MIQLRRFTQAEWQLVADQSHQAVFGKFRPVEIDRTDFVVTAWLNEEPFAYVTVKEMDSQTAYIQYGGAFPKRRNQMVVVSAFQKCLKELDKKYSFIFMWVENTNIPMIRLALHVEFIICGLKINEGTTLLELRRVKEEKK